MPTAFPTTKYNVILDLGYIGGVLATGLIHTLDYMLSMLTRQNNSDYDKYANTCYGDLSKEAKKELYLRYQDKGYEH